MNIITKSERQVLGMETKSLYLGPLTGVPMSPVDFKKCQYRIFLLFITAHVVCRIKEMALSYITIFLEALSHVTKPYVARRF